MFLSPVAYGGVVSNLEHRPDGFCQSMLVWASCCVNRDERFVSFLLGEKPRWPHRHTSRVTVYSQYLPSPATRDYSWASLAYIRSNF